MFLLVVSISVGLKILAKELTIKPRSELLYFKVRLAT